MKKSLCGFLALAMLATGVIGFSGVAEARGGRHNGYGPGYNYNNLTPEQQEKARKLHDEHYNSVAPIRQQMIVKQAELDALLINEKPDAKKVESLSRDLGELRGKMMNQRLALRDRLEKEGLPGYGMGYHNGGRRGGWHHGDRGDRGEGRGYGHGGMGHRGGW